MKAVLGVVLLLVGLAFGLYAGLWWAFIGGIVQVIEAVKADPVSAMDVALGIARIVFASMIGGLSALVFIVPGLGFLKSRR